MLSILNAEGAEYLVVGAYAYMYYAEPRYTKDFDIWVRATPENAARVYRALKRFGAPLMGATEEDFFDPAVVYQVGRPPNRIDFLMDVDGLTFDEAWANRYHTTYGGEPIAILSKDDLIRSKKAAGRPMDLIDAARLEDE